MTALKTALVIVLLLVIPYTALVYLSLRVFQGTVSGSPLVYAAAAILSGLCFMFLRKARTVPATTTTRIFDQAFKLGFLLVSLACFYLAGVLLFG